MEKPIFVIGLPRSGSTLWENIIAKNSEICRLAEMLFLTPWKKDFRYFLNNYIGNLEKEENIERLLEKVIEKKVYKGITGSFWRFEKFDFIHEVVPVGLKHTYNSSTQSSFCITA